MEVAGLVCGAVPLIVLTLQGYRLIRNFEIEYNSLNKKLKSVLRDISTEGWIFKYAFNEILAETVTEDQRKLMLDNPRCEYWACHDLHGDIQGVLGDLFLPMVQSVAGVQETLQDIKTLLLVLGGNKIQSGGKVKQAWKRLTVSMAAIANSVLESDQLGLHFENIPIQSKAKRLLSLVKDHRGDLEVLRNQLREQNRYLRIILAFRSNSRSSPKVKIPDLIRRTSLAPTPITTENEPEEVGIPEGDTRMVHYASQNLHRIISTSLSCDCHTVHLCLERQPKETVCIDDPKGKLPQSPVMEFETRFSFRLSICSGIRVSAASRRAIHLVFTKRRPQSSDTLTAPPECIVPTLTFCQQAQNDGFERYLPDTAASFPSGFLLQRVTAPAGWAKSSNSTSLEHLVKSRSGEIRSLDRFLIAAKLAHSLLHFYSSPWVRDWSLRTIHFFEKHEQPDTSPGCWTPHLALPPTPFSVRQLGDRNQEIYLLGIMLLQLGRKHLEFSDAENEELTFRKALGDLGQEMGLKYKAFVENCLISWSDRNTDLMGTGNLNKFLFHLHVLENGAKDFFCQ